MPLIYIYLALFGAAFFGVTRLGRRAADAPALMLALGAATAAVCAAFGIKGAPASVVAPLASAGLAVIGFASAAQFRASVLAKRCPSSFRLTAGGAPLYFAALSLSAFIMLPQLSAGAAALLGAALAINGAAVDRRAVTHAPTPVAIKAAVRIESAAIIAFGLPAAILIAAGVMAASPGEPPLTPLMATSVSVLKGFFLGGVIGLAAAYVGSAIRIRIQSRTGRRRSFDGALAAVGGLSAFAIAPFVGAQAIVAACAAGLLWGEQTRAPVAARLRLQHFAERSVVPLAYFGFGCFAATRISQADLLSVVFALAAVTVLRIGPRLAVLQSSSLAKEAQLFLAWYGGAPGAASALFILMLTGAPSLIDAEGVITVGALAVTAGVLGARLTSRPLVKSYLRGRAMANRRRAFAV